MLGAPTWRRLGGEVHVRSQLCVVEPGSSDILRVDVPPDTYFAWVGYQFLLGSRVGKLFLTNSGATEVDDVVSNVLEYFSSSTEGIERNSDSGMVCLGDLAELSKMHDQDTLVDRCRACSSNNEQAGVFDGVGVVSTMCMRPVYHVVRPSFEGVSSVLIDFTRGM